MDEGLYTGMVLIDLQKAFDTVDYTILTTKLNAIGIDDSAGSWFKSYLTVRKQVVKITLPWEILLFPGKLTTLADTYETFIYFYAYEVAN